MLFVTRSAARCPHVQRGGPFSSGSGRSERPTPTCAWRRRARFRAAVLACREGAALSHFAAAAFWGFWTWEERLIDVTIVGSGGPQIDGVRVHRARTPDERDVLRRDELRVTTPARTLLDLAAILPEKGLRSIVRQGEDRAP